MHGFDRWSMIHGMRSGAEVPRKADRDGCTTKEEYHFNGIGLESFQNRSGPRSALGLSLVVGWQPSSASIVENTVFRFLLLFALLANEEWSQPK